MAAQRGLAVRRCWRPGARWRPAFAGGPASQAVRRSPTARRCWRLGASWRPVLDWRPGAGGRRYWPGVGGPKLAARRWRPGAGGPMLAARRRRSSAGDPALAALCWWPSAGGPALVTRRGRIGAGGPALVARRWRPGADGPVLAARRWLPRASGPELVRASPPRRAQPLRTQANAEASAWQRGNTGHGHLLQIRRSPKRRCGGSQSGFLWDLPPSGGYRSASGAGTPLGGPAVTTTSRTECVVQAGKCLSTTLLATANRICPVQRAANSSEVRPARSRTVWSRPVRGHYGPL